MATTKLTGTLPASAGRANKRSQGIGQQVIGIILIVLLVGSVVWFYLGKPGLVKSTAKAVTTTTAVIKRGNLRLTASGSGTLVSNQVVNMSFSTSGKVAQLNVKLGDMVKKGDVLASLEKAEDLEANLASAQANLLQAQQALTTLQKGGGSALAKAYQTLLTAQSTYDDALTAANRTAGARCSDAIYNKYKSTLQAATAKVNDLIQNDPQSYDLTIAEYDYDTALANYTYCTAYTPTEKSSAQSTLEVAKATLQTAQTAYDKLKAASGVDPTALSMNETKVETAQTAVDNAQTALDGIVLKATQDGRITYLASGVGTIVDTSTFLTISDVSHPTVTVSLDETDTDKLVVGNKAAVSFTALSGKSFPGAVSLANPQMNAFGPFRAATGQVTLDDSTIEALSKMPLGMSATITITGKEAMNAILAPVEAIKEKVDGTYWVSLVGKDGTVKEQVVTVGIESATYAEITSGLQEGDTVQYTRAKSNSSGQNQDGGNFFMSGGPRD